MQSPYRQYITGALAEGAIIESGENANGRYTKFADGTMICWVNTTRTGVKIPNAYTNDIYTSTLSLIFPCQFVSPGPIGVSFFGRLGDSASWNTYAGLSNTGFSVHIIDAVIRNTAENYTYSYLAVGHWKA